MVKESPSLPCSGTDSGIGDPNSQSSLIMNENERKQNPHNEPKDPLQKADTILSWKDGTKMQNVSFLTDFENPHIFSLDLE